MALSLTLNGVTTTTIPGAPGNGDRIAMNNGSIRFSFTYGVHRSGCWGVDLVEYSANGGVSWANVLYARDEPHFVTLSGEQSMTNAALSIVTNTASTLSLQLVSSKTVSSVLYTKTDQFTMTSSQPNIEIAQYLAFGSAVTTSGGFQNLEDWGPCYFAPADAKALAVFNGFTNAYASPATPALWTRMNVPLRQYSKLGSTSARGFVGGFSLYTDTGYLCTCVASPVSIKNAVLNITDNASHQYMNPMVQFTRGTYANWFAGVDGANASHFSNDVTFFRMCMSFGNTNNTYTFPQSVSTTDATTTVNLTWSLVVEHPVTGSGYSGLPIGYWQLPQAINRWTDTLYPRPSIGGSGILGGGSGPYWQPLPTLESTIRAVMTSTYSAAFDSTYGYWLKVDDNRLNNLSNALALQTCLRWYHYGVGNSDALTMADKLAPIIANYQQQSGAQKGAIYKMRRNGAFSCQEDHHLGVGDQPHVATYGMAECVLALIEYYQVRGNQTLTTTYGSPTVSAVLDLAMSYFVSVQQSDGGWLVEYNNTNTISGTLPNNGAGYSASSTADIAASLYQWAILSPTASATQQAQWKQAAVHGLNYAMDSDSLPHGCYEYGEGYTTYSAHAAKMNMRGFARMYRLTGAPRYQEWMAYYVEWAILLCKRVEEVLNTNATGNKDVHTAALMCTLDWSGVTASEIADFWHILLTDGVMLHPSLPAVFWFYAWGSLAHTTWSYRDLTYTSSNPFGYAYATPGTAVADASAADGIDNSRFTYYAPSGALLLLATYSLASVDNANVLSTCLEASLAADTPAGRTIVLYNPQSGSQVVNLTVKGQAGKAVQQDGVAITGTKSGADLLVGPLTLTAGQISKVTTR